MLRLTRQLRLLISLTIIVVGTTLGLGSGSRSLSAQTTSPKIGTITVAGWTSQTVTIAFTLNLPAGETEAEVQVEYGTTKNYGLVYPSSYTRKSATDTLTIINLQPSTNYHFRMKVRPVGGDLATDTSADKTFATRSSDNSLLPVITVQGVVCTSDTCTVTFSTATEANVQIGWDRNFHAPSVSTLCDPAVGYPNCGSESAGQYISSTRSIRMTGLSAGTLYHYRLLATDRSGNQSMTGNAASDSEVTTAASSSDRTFSTGGCTVGGRTYPIGSCLPNGNYCAPSGEDDSCTNQCGAACKTNETCNVGGDCLVDPSANTAYQCNKSDCYAGGIFQSPARAGCYQSWSRCSANTILKVQKDRGCNLWLTCGTTVQTTPAQGQAAENLCLSLAACNQLGPKGQCTHYLPQGQCDNDPLRFCANDTDCQAGGTCLKPSATNPTQGLRDLTFTSPTEVKQVANLSGNVVAGLDWTKLNSTNVISGFLPWQLMQQIGGNIPLRNSDFETNPPDPSPWEVVPLGTDAKNALEVVYEDQDVSINHVLKVSPVTQVDRGYVCVDDQNDQNPNSGKVCDPDVVPSPCRYTQNGSTTGACQRGVTSVQFFGAATQEFTTQPNEYYYASARVRAESGNPVLRLELGHGGFKRFTADEVTTGGGTITKNTYVDTQATSAWQTISFGPIKGLSGGTRAAVVCADNDNCGEFFVDDVTVKPVLQANTDPRYLTPSCRLYPKDDSPACDYVDQNGISFKGWKGYCLENDSVSGACLSWWPVDIIRGESSIFGTDKVAGYQDRSPLYYCAEAEGGFDKKYSSTIDGYAFTLTQEYDMGHDCSFFGNIFGCRVGDNLVGYIVGSGRDWIPTAGDYDRPVNTTDAKISESDISTIFLQVAVAGMGDVNAPPASTYLVPTGTVYEGARSCLGPEWTDQPWSFCWTGNNDSISIKFVFDERGYLSRIVARARDQGSFDGAVFLKPVFVKREVCSKLVEVVTPFGENQAFAQRVNSRTVSVPDLGYRRSTDVVPFSAIAPPEPAADPNAWSRISVQTKTGEFAEGQVRSGPPYACIGDCNGSICHVANPTTDGQNGQAGNILSPSSICTTEDSNTNGRSDGYYSGGTAGASNRGNQLFDGTACVLKSNQNQPCTNGSTCVCKGTDQCVTPFDAQCTATKVVSGTGSTRALATANATQGCYIQSGRCSRLPVICTSEAPCPPSLGTCVFTNPPPLAVFAVACNGRCGANTSAAFVKRFTSFQADATGVSCTQTKFSACVADGAAGHCRRNPGIACTNAADCPGFLDSCDSAPVYKCDRDRSKTCTPNPLFPTQPDSECPYQDPIPTNQIDTICRSTILKPSPCTCTLSGSCVVDPANNTYQNAGVQEKLCNSSGDCTFDPTSGADENRFFAQERLKRLFAQSYGIWQWIDGGYVLQANSRPSDLSDGADNPDFYGWRPPSNLCPIQTSLPVLGCSKLESTQCTASLQITSRKRNSEQSARDDALGTCRTITACDGNKPECTAKGVAGTAVKYTGFQATSCTQTGTGATATWSCAGRCTVDATYTNTVPVQSSTPSFKSIRPTSAPDDYCAIPPSFSGAGFTTGNATLAVIDGGSGSIGIKFNSAADPEQVPLQTISIDWGDGRPDTISYPYAPRTDTRKPHIFSHVYSYNQADTTHCPVTDGPCTYPIKIQIRDNWGWCSESLQKYCSSSSAATALQSSQRAVVCSADADCRGQGAFQFCRSTRNPIGTDTVPAKCSSDAQFWVDSGLKVILNP